MLTLYNIQQISKQKPRIGEVFILVDHKGLISLVAARSAATALVQSWRPTCSQKVVRRSLIRLVFRLDSCLASN